MIEQRWLRRTQEIPMSYQDGRPMIGYAKDILQYRTRDVVINFGTDFNGQQFVTYDWSEWKDVSVVEGDE